jgi:hypothetical protein
MPGLRIVTAAVLLTMTSSAVAFAQPRARGFSVVLVLGDTQPGPVPDNVPVAARKALTDVKDFLPYKSYRQLDTQWIAMSPAAGTPTQAVLRLHGVDEREYVVNLNVTGGEARAAKTLNIKFGFEESGQVIRVHTSAGFPELERLKVDLNRRRAAATNPDSGGAARSEIEAIETAMRDLNERTRQAAELRSRAQMVRTHGRLIDTGFDMAVGETVVVGTSRIGGGDKALIVLLTAASAPK